MHWSYIRWAFVHKIYFILFCWAEVLQLRWISCWLIQVICFGLCCGLRGCQFWWWGILLDCFNGVMNWLAWISLSRCSMVGPITITYGIRVSANEIRMGAVSTMLMMATFFSLFNWEHLRIDFFLWFWLVSEWNSSIFHMKSKKLI